MDDAFLMGGSKALGELTGVLDGFLQGKWMVGENRAQRGATEELRNDEI